LNVSIPAPELAALVERAAVGAAPNEEAVAHLAADQMRRVGKAVSSSSLTSKSLYAAIDATRPELGAEAIRRLAEMQIYGHESLYINAIPNVRRQTKQIIVFDGLKHLIHYHASLIRVLDRLQTLRPDAEYMLPNGSTEPEALACSMAGYALLDDFQKTFRKPVFVHDMLGRHARAEIAAAYRGALCFTLLHELAHIELGHLAFSPARSETRQFSLLEPEALNACQYDELAADAFALCLIPQQSRAAFGPSLVFMVGAFAFLEAFSGNLSADHPLAVNRMSQMVALCEMPVDDQAIYIGWIDHQVEKLQQFAAARVSGGGSIRERIAMSMPASLATRIIVEIKKRVRKQHGLL
jgi:hypothetical protein